MLALHLIPDDGDPHAPTTECGCGVRMIRFSRPDGTVRGAFVHGLDLTDEEAGALGGYAFRLRADAPGWVGVAGHEIEEASCPRP